MRAFGAFLFFLIYLFVARYLFLCPILGNCNPEDRIVRPATLQVRSEDGRRILTGFQEFGFPPDSPRPLLSTNNRVFLDSLTEYLLLYPESELRIRASYRDREKSLWSDRFENLGLARGDRIRQLLVEKGIPEDDIYLDFFVTDSLNLGQPVRFELFRSGIDKGPAWPEKYLVQEMCYSAILFPAERTSAPVHSPLRIYADQVQAYLKEYPIAGMEVIGHYTSAYDRRECNRLSLALAERAHSQLEEMGVHLRVEVKGRGNRFPQVSEKDPLATQKNDRVVFRLIPQIR